MVITWLLSTQSADDHFAGGAVQQGIYEGIEAVMAAAVIHGVLGRADHDLRGRIRLEWRQARRLRPRAPAPHAPAAECSAVWRPVPLWSALPARPVPAPCRGAFSGRVRVTSSRYTRRTSAFVARAIRAARSAPYVKSTSAIRGTRITCPLRAASVAGAGSGRGAALSGKPAPPRPKRR